MGVNANRWATLDVGWSILAIDSHSENAALMWNNAIINATHQR